MNLSQSMAIKAAGSVSNSTLAANVQKIRNTNQKQLVPGKANTQASVDKTNSQF